MKHKLNYTKEKVIFKNVEYKIEQLSMIYSKLIRIHPYDEIYIYDK